MSQQRRIVVQMLLSFSVAACTSDERTTADAGVNAGGVNAGGVNAGGVNTGGVNTGGVSTGGAGAPSASSLSTLVVASLCSVHFAFTLTSCQGLDALTACAKDQCGLGDCTGVCGGLVSCAVAAGDACSAQCARTTECNDCLDKTIGCVVPGCLGTLVCTTTTRGGTCDQVRSCCGAAKDASTQQMCLSAVELISQLSGDSGCLAGSKDQTIAIVSPEVARCVDDVLGRDR